MKTKQTIGLIVAVVLFIVTGVASVITNTVSESIFDKVTEEVLSEGVTFAPPSGDYIAVVDIVGTIQQQSGDTLYSSEEYRHTTTMNYIDSLINDDNNQGMLLYVDSPEAPCMSPRKCTIKSWNTRRLPSAGICVYGPLRRFRRLHDFHGG